MSVYYGLKRCPARTLTRLRHFAFWQADGDVRRVDAVDERGDRFVE